MRMWMVNPRIMCKKHLLGEHVECHMFVGTINEGKSIKGYLDNGLLNVDDLWSRHLQLAKEMTNRGYNHESNLKQIDWSKIKNNNYPSINTVDKKISLQDLLTRCEDCFNNYVNLKVKEGLVSKLWDIIVDIEPNTLSEIINETCQAVGSYDDMYIDWM